MSSANKYLLRKMPRINYCEPEELDMDQYIFCTQCEDYVFEYCSIHGPLLAVPDNKVPKRASSTPRAALTIPNVFLHIAPSTIPGAGLGVFCTLTMPMDVRFGPYRGNVTKEVTSDYYWQIFDRNRSPLHMIDASDANASNWLRYVNCSRNFAEQNLIAFQYRGQMYYRTIKIIPRGSELLVYYGSEFAKKLDIDLRRYNSTAQTFGVYTSYTLPQDTISKDMVLYQPEIVPYQTEIVPKQTEMMPNETGMVPYGTGMVPHGTGMVPYGTGMVPYGTGMRQTEMMPNETGMVPYGTGMVPHGTGMVPYGTGMVPYGTGMRQTEMMPNETGMVPYGTGMVPYGTGMVPFGTGMVQNQPLSESTDENEVIVLQKVEDQLLMIEDWNMDEENANSGFEQYIENSRIIQSDTEVRENPKVTVEPKRKTPTQKCNMCDFKSTIQEVLQKHSKLHDPLRAYPCNVCNYRFANKQDFDRHSSTHKDYTCDICKDNFKAIKDLMKHKSKHAQKKVYRCNICDFQTTRSTSLTNHMKSSFTHGSFKCQLCDFTTNGRLQYFAHTKTHDGEQECVMCDYKTTKGASMAAHLEWHEKKYECDKCEHKYSYAHLLKRHRFYQHGEKL